MIGASPPAVVHIDGLAQLLDLSPSTLYKTWRQRVRDNRLPPTLPGGKPAWSRDTLNRFLSGELTLSHPDTAPRGRPPRETPRTTSAFDNF